MSPHFMCPERNKHWRLTQHCCVNGRYNRCALLQLSVPTEVVPLSTGIVYKPPEYQEHDFSEAPKFTTGMPDRCTTVGYSAKLLCSVRGCPKVTATGFYRWTRPGHGPHLAQSWPSPQPLNHLSVNLGHAGQMLGRFCELSTKWSLKYSSP